MENPWLIVLVTIATVFVVRLLLVFLLAGGDAHRVSLAIRGSWRVLRDRDFASRVEPLLAPPSPKEEAPRKPDARPVRLLALLQREGRLLDFLLEDIQTYADDQVGAAVRDIHRQCQAVLKEHLVLEPVLRQSEGDSVQVPAGFDPSAIRLTGNVTGEPPFQGVLRHHGWRAREINVAPPPEGQDELVLMPAEVELL